MKDVFFKNIRAYSLVSMPTDKYGPSREELEAMLKKHEFVQADSCEAQSVGWVPYYLAGHELVYQTPGRPSDFFVRLRVQTKALSSKAVAQETDKRSKLIAQEQGYTPGRKQRTEIKERVRDEMLARAPSVYRDFRARLNYGQGFLMLDTTTNSAADRVIGMLVKTIDPLPLENIYPRISPAQAMSDWLASDEPPSGFSVDQEAVLRSSGGGGVVKYSKQSIGVVEAVRHIQSGKQCTSLALTLNDRISFILAENMDIKRIKPLDVLRASVESAEAMNAEEEFDSSMCIFAEDSTNLLNELLYALGGVKDIGGASDTEDLL